MRPRIVVQVEGGVVQAVITDSDLPLDVAVIDYDTDGTGDVLILGQAPCEGHIEAPLRDPAFVDQAFAALGKGCQDSAAVEGRYLKSQGLRCPNCASRNIDAATPEIDGNRCTCDIECADCHATWTEIYVLSGILDLTTN